MLIDADMVANQASPDDNHVSLWMRQARDAEGLIELTSALPEMARAVTIERPLLQFAIDNDRDALEVALATEQIRGKQADREYWAPLRAELEQMRHDQRRGASAE